LQLVDDAATKADLSVLPGNCFEALRGQLRGYHAIRINKQWRLVFRWDDELGEASDLYLDDHSYR
jgi:toxin HigB-1